MKNKSSYLLIMMLSLSGLMALATAPVATQAQDNTIVIGVVEGSLKFNVTEVALDPSTTYTIIFHNNDALAKHNLRIDSNDNLEDNEDVSDSGDITIGEANDHDDGTGGPDKIWQGTFTTGEDGVILFYCGYAGHYTGGMVGEFVIGEGDAPGFGLFAGLAALLFIGFAVPTLRRR